MLTFPKAGVTLPQRGVQRLLWPFTVNRDSPQADGLLAWWPTLPDPRTARDLSLALGPDGDLLAGYASGVAVGSDSDFGLAWSFDGSDGQALSMGSAGNVAISGDQLTLTTWFKATAHNSYGGISGKGEDSSAASSYNIYFLSVTDQLQWFVNTQSGSAAVNSIASTYADGLWHHVVGTYNGTQIEFFVDGMSQGTAALTGDVYSSSDRFMLGRYDTTNRTIVGQIAEARLYSRALLADEVAALYAPRTRWDLYYPLRQRISFPPQLPSPGSSPDQFADNAQTTLARSIDSLTSLLVVDSTGDFPSLLQFRILVDNELMLVTSMSGTIWQVVRGIENTTPASHAANAIVTQVLTAGAANQFAQVSGGQLGGTGQVPDVRGLRETGGPTLLTLGTWSDGQILARSGSTLVGLTPLPSNCLINGGFDFAQRQSPASLTTIPDNTYSADRWKITRQNADLRYQRIDTNGALESGITARFYGTFKQITNVGKFVVFQPLEGSATFPQAGRTIIFQAKMKASTAKTIRMAVLQLTNSGTIDSIPNPFVPSTWGANSTDPTWATNLAVAGSVASQSVGTSWASFNVNVTAPSDAENLILAMWTDSAFSVNDTLSITEAGLYDGSNPLPWIPRSPQQELALCQRYYTKSFPLDTAPIQNGGATGQVETIQAAGASASCALPFTQFPVRMRVTPTVTLYNPDAANAQVRNGSTASDWSGCSVQSGNADLGFQVSGTTPGGSSAGNVADFHYSADADL